MCVNNICNITSWDRGTREMRSSVPGGGSSPSHTEISFTAIPLVLDAARASRGWVTALQILEVPFGESPGEVSLGAERRLRTPQLLHAHTQRLQTRPGTPCAVIYSSVPLRNVKEDKRVQRTMIILQIIKSLSEKQIPPAQSKPPLGKPFQAPSTKFLKSLSLPGTPLPVCKGEHAFFIYKPNNNNKILISRGGRETQQVLLRCRVLVLGTGSTGEAAANLVIKSVY